MSERETIDISGLSKATVLAALYNASKPQGLGFLHYDAAPMTEAEAARIITSVEDTGPGGIPDVNTVPGSTITKRQATTRTPARLYFDYLKGRVMKVDLSGDTLDPSLYDRDNGGGAAARVIASLRAS